MNCHIVGSNDDDEEARFANIRARKLAAELRRTHQSGIHARQQKDKSPPKSPEKSKSRDKSPDSVESSTESAKKKYRKRKEKERERSRSRSRSPITKASDILNKEDWPVGYSKSKINKMGVNGALKLAAQQAAKKKKSYEGLPGVKVSNEDVKIETISIKSGKDNADDILHPQRFRLRPPVSPPDKWWDDILEEWPERKKQFAGRYLGSGSSIPMKTFLAANDRSIALRAKHFLERNYNVDTRGKKGKAQLKDDGSLEYEGFDKNYFDPETLQDMLLAIANLQATYYQLWPWDYTPLVILRVAARYNFFSNGKAKQIDIFAKFFDKILEKNAEEPSKPPLTYEQANLEAIVIMERNGCPPVVPLVSR